MESTTSRVWAASALARLNCPHWRYENAATANRTKAATPNKARFGCRPLERDVFLFIVEPLSGARESPVGVSQGAAQVLLNAKKALEYYIIPVNVMLGDHGLGNLVDSPYHWRNRRVWRDSGQTVHADRLWRALEPPVTF